jgi:excisionase family DNA binding protein
MPTPETVEPVFLTVPEVARLLRCSKPTIYRRIASGEIPAVRLGAEFGPLRIRRDELEEWLYGYESVGGSPPAARTFAERGVPGGEGQSTNICVSSGRPAPETPRPSVGLATTASIACSSQ